MSGNVVCVGLHKEIENVAGSFACQSYLCLSCIDISLDSTLPILQCNVAVSVVQGSSPARDTVTIFTCY